MPFNDPHKNYSRRYGDLSRHRINEIIDNEQLLPSNQIIGKDCKNNHGKDGKTVRYLRKNTSTKSGDCVACNYERELKRNRKKIKQENEEVFKHKKAMDILEEKKYHEDDLL